MSRSSTISLASVDGEGACSTDGACSTEGAVASTSGDVIACCSPFATSSGATAEEFRLKKRLVVDVPIP